jgi:hypothetical protein
VKGMSVMSREGLMSSIEAKRVELYVVGSKLPLTDGRVVAISEELDVLLNMFEAYQCKDNLGG